MENKNPQNCWEYWGCPEEVRNKCGAYTTGSGRECWFVVGTDSGKDKKCPKLTQTYHFCWECPWFKKLNPDFDKHNS